MNLFVRSDAISDDGRIWNPGGNGTYYSSRSNSDTIFQHVFIFDFNASGIGPSYDNVNRYLGIPLRCLVR